MLPVIGGPALAELGRFVVRGLRASFGGEIRGPLGAVVGAGVLGCSVPELDAHIRKAVQKTVETGFIMLTSSHEIIFEAFVHRGFRAFFLNELTSGHRPNHIEVGTKFGGPRSRSSLAAASRG